MEKLEHFRQKFKEFINDIEVDKLHFGLKQPNIFEILKISSAEIRHSNFLAWLLNPDAGHGLSSIFIEKILREIFSSAQNLFPDKFRNIDEFFVDEINYKKIEIIREWKHASIGSRKSLDLLIKHPEFIITIENKIYSTDGDEQLSTYIKLIEDYFPDYENRSFFVYLTPEGTNPADIKAGESYIKLSYKTIIDFLNNMITINEEGISSSVKQYITDYTTILSREIMGDEELVKYARNIYKQHQELIDFVNRYGKLQKFREAFDKFINGNVTFKEVNSKANNEIPFIATSWELYTEELKKLSRDKFPVIMFYLSYFQKSTGKSFVVKLGLQVRPFKDEKERTRLLQILRDKELISKDTSSYTTIFTTQVEIEEISNEEEIFNAFKKLQERLKENIVINEVNDSLELFFKAI